MDVAKSRQNRKNLVNKWTPSTSASRTWKKKILYFELESVEPSSSLVPIHCYGHHGPAVRRGLKTLRKIPSTTCQRACQRLVHFGRQHL